MEADHNHERGISILVGDSSGATGLATATVLDQLMKRIQVEDGLADTPLVEDYFDIVAGAGTAAIIMTLTGRLGMKTEEAMTCFAKLSSEVFSDKNLVGKPAFKALKMEKALKDILCSQTGQVDEPMLDMRITSKKPKTMVFAMSKYSPSGSVPTIFRSYQSDNPGPNCTIWQALRAATAHPEMFKAMEIEDASGIRESFVDAAMGCSNPIEHVLKEAKRLYPNRQLASIISIGGGHPRAIQIPNPSPLNRIFPAKLINAMQAIASDSERMAETMAERFQETPNLYFRLNVEQGMQSIWLGDWGRLGEIKAHARAYMQKVEPDGILRRAVKAIKEQQGVVSVNDIDGVVRAKKYPQAFDIKECPTPTCAYTERYKPVQQAIDCLTHDLAGDRRVFVFYGLGGAGKTQLALQTVKRTREHWSYVIYVNAASLETLSGTLRAFAVARGIGNTHEDTLRWLATLREPWLLFFDNADDPSLQLQHYFPESETGRIMVTTRSRNTILLARGPESACNVSGMEPDEALRLLFTVARVNEGTLSDEERNAAMSLTQELGYFALAIAQAGAYIWSTRCKFAQYLYMYTTRPQETLEQYSKVPAQIDHYDKTVYGTWITSYQMLSERAKMMLWLLVYLQHDSITQEIFRRAANKIEHYKPVLPLTGILEEALTSVKEYLGSFLVDDMWNPSAFLSIMAEIMSYSLISYDKLNETYVLHVLVQNWTATAMSYSPDRALAQSIFLLAMSIDRERQAEDYAYRWTLELHIEKVLKHSTEARQYVCAEFGYIMYSNKHYERAKALQLQALEICVHNLGHDAEETLMAKKDLATTYTHQGLYDDAEKLEAQVLETRIRTLGKEHPDTLTAMLELAGTYSNKGLYKEAETLQTQVVESRRNILGTDHPDTLRSMHNLALTYYKQGVYEQAEARGVQALEIAQRVLGKKHPDTLVIENNLALTYSKQGLYSMAETLQAHILESWRRLLGDNHPNVFTSMSDLALTYSSQGRYQQAEELQLQALQGRKRLLGEEHSDTLASMSGLASTYSKKGLHKQAEELQVQSLNISKRIFGDKDIRTLGVMAALAITYSRQGLYKQAEELQTFVLDTRKQVLAIEHPDTLMAMSNLATTYYNQNQLEQAESLYEQSRHDLRTPRQEP
ncbi:kinesin light chain [Ceratobasidium sp. AG-Ba]|nr:kinesin light chain [Ceratobasidium sp. AG-Ba]